MPVDGFRVHVDTHGALRDLREIERRTDRAVMWGVRECGRELARVAKRTAPVYRGPARNVDVNGKQVPIVRGELRRSIKSSRRMRRVGGGHAITVGPRGEHVHLYAGRQEDHAHYMRPAFEALDARAPEIFAKALERAFRSATRGRR